MCSESKLNLFFSFHLKLHAVVNNAGIAQAGCIEWDTIETIKHVYDVNTFGYLRVMRKFLPMLRKTVDSRMINMGSLASINPAPYSVGYGLSKVRVNHHYHH